MPGRFDERGLELTALIAERKIRCYRDVARWPR